MAYIQLLTRETSGYHLSLLVKLCRCWLQLGIYEYKSGVHVLIKLLLLLVEVMIIHVVAFIIYLLFNVLNLQLYISCQAKIDFDEWALSIFIIQQFFHL